MAYSDPAAVRDALTKTGAVDEATAASLDDPQLNSQIAEADAEIDARLSVRYTVPLDPVPALVANISRDIAALLATYVLYRGVPVDQRHPVWLRATQARTLLDQLAAGKADVGAPETPGGETNVVNPYEGDLFRPEDSWLELECGDRIGVPGWGDPGRTW